MKKHSEPILNNILCTGVSRSAIAFFDNDVWNDMMSILKKCYVKRPKCKKKHTVDWNFKIK